VKKKLKKNPYQRHISSFGELEGGKPEKKNLQGHKSDQKFHKGENWKWYILQG